MEAEALVNILADTLEEEKVESSRAGLHTSQEPKTVGDTLGDVEAKELLVAMAHAPAVVEARTTGDTLGDV